MIPSDNSFPRSGEVGESSRDGAFPCETLQRWQDAVGKERRRLYHTQWRVQNRERKLAMDKAWKQRNKERADAACKRWHLLHPAKTKAANRKYHNKNRAKINAGHRAAYKNLSPERKAEKADWHAEYYAKNKKRYRQQAKAWFAKHPHRRVLYAAKRRVLTLGVEREKIETHWEKIKAKKSHKCFYCQARISKFHMEHLVPISKGGGHLLCNIVVSCQKCNNKKSSKLPNEFIKKGQLVLL